MISCLIVKCVVSHTTIVHEIVMISLLSVIDRSIQHALETAEKAMGKRS